MNQFRPLDGRSGPSGALPNLKSLLLQGFSTSEVHLKEVLVAHAASLQSLEISQMNLKSYESKGKVHHGSWVRIILFLRESLNLHFHDSLTNEGNENWRVREAVVAYDSCTPPVREDLTFKNRVERYIVEGGEFPLPRPQK